MLSIKWVVLSLVSTMAFGVLASADGLPVVSSSCDLGDGNSLTINYGGPVMEYPRDVLKFNEKDYRAAAFDQVGAEVIYKITSSGDDVQEAQPSPDSSVTYSKKSFEFRSVDGSNIFNGSPEMTTVEATCADQHGFEALAR